MRTLLPLLLVVGLTSGGLTVEQGNAQVTRGKVAPSLPLVDATVVSVDAAHRQIVLDHGDLPNLAMPPMTMGFEVADKVSLKGLKPGDKVLFQAEALNGEATVTELRRKR